MNSFFQMVFNKIVDFFLIDVYDSKDIVVVINNSFFIKCSFL